MLALLITLLPCPPSFISSSILPSHQVLHSLRASNAAFAGTPQDGHFWACKEYCVDYSHGWSENGCTSACEEMTEDQLICLDACKEDSMPDIEPWDDCVCECTGNCLHKGSGVSLTSTPTIIYTRPPAPSPSQSSSSQSLDYDAVE